MNVCCVVAMLATGVLAQEPRVFTIDAIPGANAVAVGLLWEHRSTAPGAAPMDAGAAAIVAQCRLAQGRARVPGVEANLHVDGEVTCIVAVAPAGSAVKVGEFAAAVLDDGRAVSDDTIAMATARVALLADDLRYLVPSGVLTTRARAGLGVPNDPVGDSRAMLQLTPAQVRDLWRQPIGVMGAVRGAVDAGLLERLGRLSLVGYPQQVTAAAASAAAAAATANAAAAAPPSGIREEIHTRIDQPFVMAAFVAPEAELPAFVVGCEIARERAARRFKLRGSELRAGTPFVAWSTSVGDRIVCFHRRGATFVTLLPGEVGAVDAKAELAATAAELRAFLADLLQNPPTEAEVSNARTHTLAELGLEPATPANSNLAVLGGRLRASMLARRRGLALPTITAVTAEQVQRTLAAALDPARGYWHALMPNPQADRGWRRR